MPKVIHVSIKDLPGAYRELTRQRMQRAVRAIQITCRTRAIKTIHEQILVTRPPPFNTGAYRLAWKASDIAKGSLIYNTTAYAAVIELGRRAGARMPPVDALIPWVRRKLGIRNMKEARSAAYVIARKIAERGLPAKHVLANAATKFMPIVRKAVHEALSA